MAGPRFTIEDLVADGDLVAARLTHTGAAQRAMWKGLPPTGGHIEVDAMFFFRFGGGRLVEVWEVEGEYAMWEQLGKSLDTGGWSATIQPLRTDYLG